MTAFKYVQTLTMFSLISRFCLLFLFYSYAHLALATDIKQVQINLQNQRYLLTADIDYRLSDVAREALENGVTLFWNLHIKVFQHRHYWFAKTLLDMEIHYRLQYHALLNMYRVVIVQPNHPLLPDQPARTDSYNFSTLSAALDLMANLHDFPLINDSDLKNHKRYFVEIKAEFDREALPLPLRPIAYTNPQWYLSSDWTVWNLKK